MFQNKQVVWLTAFFLFLGAALLMNCSDSPPASTPTLTILSVTTDGTSSRLYSPAFLGIGSRVPPTDFAHGTPTVATGYIIAGAPEYLDVELQRIVIKGTFTDSTTGHEVWSGNKTIRLDGTTPIDTSGMTLSFVAGDVTSIELTFAATGTIKGSVTGNLSDGSGGSIGVTTFNTKTALAYDASVPSGGDASYTSFEGGTSEATTVNLMADDTAMISTDVDFSIAEGDAPAMTILVDLSRMLRFYNGLNSQGPNPPDTAGNAYFFCHSVFANSMAAFFGTPGHIEGYEALYSAYEGATQDYSGTPVGITGWMTLVYNSNDAIIQGILCGDDDNAFTVGKGRVFETVPASGVYQIDYYLGVPYFTLHDFEPAASITDTGVFLFDDNGENDRYGEVKYTLLFRQ